MTYPVIHLWLVTGMLVWASAPSHAGQNRAPAAGQESSLISVIRSDASRQEKAAACCELARIGSREAVNALAALLPNEELSHMARYALETIPDSSVDRAFRDALAKAHGRPLVGIIASIGVRRDTKAVSALARLLPEADREIAQAAARALGQIGTPTAARVLRKAWPSAASENRLALAEGLFRCADGLVARKKWNSSVEIYDLLRAPPAPDQVRAGALRGAILARRRDGIPLLAQSLAQADATAFQAALRTAMEMPGPEVTQALTGQMQRVSSERQVLIIQALGQRGDPSALPALFDAAKNAGRTARVFALRALAEIGHPSAVSLLNELITCPDTEVAEAAQDSLAAISGAEADAVVLAMLQGTDSRRQKIGLDLVSHRRMAAALPDCIRLARGTDPTLRPLAAKRLGELGGPEEMPRLLELLVDARTSPDREALEQALTALCLKQADRDRAAATIADWLRKAGAEARCSLLRVLGATGGSRALKQVREAISDSDPDVHAAALRALRDWNGVEAAPELLDLAQRAPDASDRSLCLRSYLALASRADLPARDRLSMCRAGRELAQRPEEKRLLLSALSGLEDREALELIGPLVDDESVKLEAGNAAVAVAEKLIKKKLTAAESTILEVLAQVEQLSTSADLQQRARALLEKARRK